MNTPSKYYLIILFIFSIFISSCSDDDTVEEIMEEDPGQEEPIVEEPIASADEYLVAHYKLDGNTNDASENNRNADLVGESSEVDGINGSAYFLNEIDGENECGRLGGSYIQLPTFGEIWQEGFSITAWVQFEENRKFERIVDLGNGWGEDEGLPITFSRYDTLNDLALTSWINSDPVTNRERGRLIAEDVIENGVLQFVAATISADGEMKIYVDGVLVAEKEDGHGIVNVERRSNYIGRSNYCVEDDDFRGVMDDVRLFNKNLSEAQILEIYNSSR